MKIRVNCVVSIEGMRGDTRRKKTWQLGGYISAPCLPLEGTNLWFLDDVDTGSNPAVVIDNKTFHETKEGVFEPEIEVEWKIGDYFGGESITTFEHVITNFEKFVLEGLTKRGWRSVCEPIETHAR